MNFKTYQNLTDKQRDEYNFLKVECPVFTISGVLMGVSFVWLSVMLVLFTAYFVVKEPSLEIYRTDIYTYIASLSKVTLVMTLYCMYCLLEYLVNIIMWNIKYFKWKKENNIHYEYWWSKWLKSAKTS